MIAGGALHFKKPPIFEGAQRIWDDSTTSCKALASPVEWPAGNHTTCAVAVVVKCPPGPAKLYAHFRLAFCNTVSQPTHMQLTSMFGNCRCWFARHPKFCPARRSRRRLGERFEASHRGAPGTVGSLPSRPTRYGCWRVMLVRSAWLGG